MQNIQIKLIADRAKRTFIKLAGDIKDLTPVWNEFISYWQGTVMPETWKSQGRNMEGQKWTSLTPEYLAWKRKHYPGKRLLELTGKLYGAVTGGAGWYQKAEKQRLEFGVQGEDYFWWVSERETNPRRYFYNQNEDMPPKVWHELINLTNRHLESADD
jgi:hypothetical protein